LLLAEDRDSGVERLTVGRVSERAAADKP
jgi:hypothetical protein